MKTDNQRRRSLNPTLLLVAALGLWVFVGLSELAWHRANNLVTYPLRLVAGVAAIAFYRAYLRAWRAKHEIGVTADRRIGVHGFPELRELSVAELHGAIDGIVARRGHMSLEDARKLANHLITPEKYRYKVVENVTVRTQQTLHTIDVRWRPSSFVVAGSAHIVPVMRPRKLERPREVTIPGGRLLSSFETIALLQAVVCTLAHLPSTRGQRETIELAQREMLALITDPSESEDDDKLTRVQSAVALAKTPNLNTFWRPWRAPSHEREPEPEWLPLLRLLMRRRPYFASFDDAVGAKLAATQVVHRSDRQSPPVSPDYDGWRSRKDRYRERLHLPRRHVYLNLERARSAASYELHVHCAEHLFVDEVNVWASKSQHWVEPQPRQRSYEAYIGWEPPSGKAFANVGAANLAGTETLTDLWLALRLTEKPPGMLAPATSVSFATLVAIWLVGATGVMSTGGADLVAFILALPAVGATALGLVSSGASQGLRSMTAFISLASSLFLSLVAVGLYLSQHQAEHFLRAMPLRHSRYFYFLDDKLWIVLFCFATASFAITAGTLFMRVGRYADLLRGVPEGPTS